MNEPVASKALQVNLQRTAASVVIPDDQQLLLRIVEPIYGIHQDVEKLLHEINHPYVGWPETLSQLGFRALDSFDYFNRDDRGAEAIGVFNSLFAKSVNEARPHALREDALRHWLSYLEQVVELSGIHLSRNLPPLAAGLSSIASILAEEAELSVAISPRLKRFCRVLRQSEVSGPEGEKAMDLAMSLLQLSLKKVYELWLRLDDPLAWFEKHEVSSRAAMDIISHRALRGFLETLASCPEGDERAQVLLSLPDNSHVERAYIDATSAMTAKDVTSWKTDLARSEWLFMILSTNALAAVHDTALRYVVNSTSKVLREAESEEAERFLRQIFGLFRQERFHSNVAMLDAIRAIGLDVLRIGCALLSRTLYDELIDLPFNEPEIRGVNDDWQVQVNPAHLANIRTYLAIIEPDPVGGRKLITALVAQLRLGGVFLADTDLFQKDISSLLNCNIGPVYARTKQLLRVFPVFFNEIGAEGELRSVSTRIDEINSRRDPLCHFLRKQCHVESNPRLVHMTRAIGKYWATGDKSALQNLVPSSLYEALDSPFPEQEAIRAILVELGAGEDPLAEPGYAELLSRLDQESTELGQEKVRLLFKLHGLLAAKYCSSPIDVIAQLKSSQRLSQVCPPEEIEALQADLEKGDFRDALVRVLTQLDRLKELILSPEKFEAIEDIYYKRHIAVGIPSMYGRYMETKFDAMGLTFRLEALANTLFEKLFDSENLNFITKRGLILATEWLNLLIRALRIDGFRTTGLEAPISMLERANSASGISVDQYINIFQFISVSIKNHIRANYLDTYQPLFERIASSKLGRSGSEHVEELKRSETNIRELLSQSFALQQLDGLVSRILGVLSYEKEMLDLPTINLLMTYNVDRCFAPIRTSQTPHDDIIYLGNKGYHLKRLANLHYQVPFGFVMTTEVFRCLDAILGFEELLRDMESRTFRLIQRMGGLTGKRFGDPSNPLLLSVRSGAAISMPGMMDTFLNVGLNPEITEGLFAKTGASWFAWDCYRRFMQCWGMSFGMSRDLFDDLMRKTKEMHGIEKKAQLAPDAMKELAMRYRDAIREA
ncbi:MAG: PEP/pyruvate-binding domain-containing protein, partial [Polyangia bacterium]|nr:PEP/pyruvate-binding domain-containing protein [Polyangia bacterium]